MTDHTHMESSTLVKLIWTRTITPSKREIYATDASDLDANIIYRPRNQCPKCDGFFQKKDLIGIQTTGSGEDEEIGFWHFICPNCRVSLQVFND